MIDSNKFCTEGLSNSGEIDVFNTISWSDQETISSTLKCMVSTKNGDKPISTTITHSTGLDEGKTCIDCHKGIAHHLQAGWEEAAEKAGL